MQQSLKQNDFKEKILLRGFNRKRVKRITIAPADAEFLVKMAGDNLLHLSTEIVKMATYLSGKGDITADVIQSLVPRTPEMDVFRLTDAYVTGKIADTVSIYHDLLRNGEEPIMLTSLIASQIRLMIHVGYLRKKGYQQHQIAKTLSVHPYRVKLMMENKVCQVKNVYY